MKRWMSPMVHLRGWQPFGVHLVGRDGGLREIVEQVVGQDLDRQHRQERQERARAQHAEHVPEVRAGGHLDVLDDVAEHPRPSITPCSRISRLFSSRMMSDDSLAMSTALSTEMPTSAALSAGASLMPSPMKPTTWPLTLQRSDDALFVKGQLGENAGDDRRLRPSGVSFIGSISEPSKNAQPAGQPACRCRR